MSKHFPTFIKFFAWLKILGTKSLKLKKFFKGVFFIIVVIASLMIIINYSMGNGGYLADDEGYYDDEGSECNVQGIELHGTVLTYIPPEDLDMDYNILADKTSADNVIYTIRQAEKDDTIKAILLEVDSYGGSPVAAEEIRQALMDVQKPVVAYIREGGTSAAYLAAIGADEIIATKYSDVGGIGVTYSYIQNVKQNEDAGLEYIELTSGKFKDTGVPDRPLSAEEKQLYQRDIDTIYNGFISAVAENRGLSIEQVKKLADGSSMLGELALANGLIDQVGDIKVVREYLNEIIGEDIKVCW